MFLEDEYSVATLEPSSIQIPLSDETAEKIIIDELNKLFGAEVVSEVFLRDPTEFSILIESINSLGINKFQTIAKDLVDILGSDNVVWIFRESPYLFIQSIDSIGFLSTVNFREFVNFLGRDNIIKAFRESPYDFYLLIEAIDAFGIENCLAVIDVLGKENVVKVALFNLYGLARAIELIADLGRENFEIVVNVIGKEIISRLFTESNCEFSLLIETINSLSVERFISLIRYLREYLGNDVFSGVFLNYPADVVSTIKSIDSLGRDNFQYLIDSLGEENIFRLFSEKPYLLNQIIEAINVLSIDKLEELINHLGKESVSCLFEKAPLIFVLLLEKVVKNIASFYDIIETIKDYYFGKTGRYSALIWQEFGLIVWEEEDLVSSLEQLEWEAIYNLMCNVPVDFFVDFGGFIIKEFTDIGRSGEYNHWTETATIYMHILRRNPAFLLQVIFHELAHHIDNVYFQNKAFLDLYSRSIHDGHFAYELGNKNSQEDFATVVEMCFFDTRIQLLRGIEQALRGDSLYWEKVLFVLDLFTKGHPNCAVIYRIIAGGRVIKKEIGIERDVLGNIVSIGGISVSNLEALKQFFLDLEI
ncbi:MAG: hypothetical protein NC818_02150 [Candidatus Omnitrophica bacterium]|nr:hypothetical protein [Candidatus Omnitrophota bacterium]